MRFDTSETQWRRIAHKIADIVYERMTGESGYFDTLIVYVSETGPADRRIKRIAVMDQDGANNRFLTDGANLVLTPRISPDGRRIAYLEYQGTQPRVYLRDLLGSRATALGALPGMTFSPASPRREQHAGHRSLTRQFRYLPHGGRWQRGRA